MKSLVLEKVWLNLEKKKSVGANRVLSKECVQNELEKLHKLYVLVPTDKAVI